MTNRIRIADLRRDIAPETGDPTDDIVVLNTSEALAFIDTAEATRAARDLVASAIAAVPVRDANQDAHIALEKARQTLNRAIAPFDFGDKDCGVV